MTTLGHGQRVGIWVAGCNKNCENCMSESLKSFDSGVTMTIDEICKAVKKPAEECDGFTISGGEPFLQIEDLSELTNQLSSMYTDDIIIYTGYTLDQLKRQHPEAVCNIISNVAVIIDGEYVEEFNDGIGLRGSFNQKVHIFKHHDKHQDLETQERKVQIVEHQKGMTIIGIP